MAAKDEICLLKECNCLACYFYHLIHSLIHCLAVLLLLSHSLHITTAEMAQAGLPVPVPYKAGQDFSRWLRSCEYYMIASGVTSATRKAATVLTLLGTEIQELVRTLPVPDGAGSDEYSQLTAKLKTHFEANMNVTYERAQLHAFVRKDGENFRSFVSRLLIQADRCQ